MPHITGREPAFATPESYMPPPAQGDEQIAGQKGMTIFQYLSAKFMAADISTFTDGNVDTSDIPDKHFKEIVDYGCRAASALIGKWNELEQQNK